MKISLDKLDPEARVNPKSVVSQEQLSRIRAVLERVVRDHMLDNPLAAGVKVNVDVMQQSPENLRDGSVTLQICTWMGGGGAEIVIPARKSVVDVTLSKYEVALFASRDFDLCGLRKWVEENDKILSAVVVSLKNNARLDARKGFNEAFRQMRGEDIGPGSSVRPNEASRRNRPKKKLTPT